MISTEGDDIPLGYIKYESGFGELNAFISIVRKNVVGNNQFIFPEIFHSHVIFCAAEVLAKEDHVMFRSPQALPHSNLCAFPSN